MNSEQEMRQEQFSDRLDILKHVSDIKVRIKDDITNDFVLAKLGEKDKEFIIEMTGNAYFSKKLVDTIKDKGETWVYENGEYKRQKLSEDDKEKVKKIAKAIFDSYMVKIYMTVILNRNVDKNYLINVLSGYVEREEQETELTSDKNKMEETVRALLADNSKEK